MGFILLFLVPLIVRLGCSFKIFHVSTIDCITINFSIITAFVESHRLCIIVFLFSFDYEMNINCDFKII